MKKPLQRMLDEIEGMLSQNAEDFLIKRGKLVEWCKTLSDDRHTSMTEEGKVFGEVDGSGCGGQKGGAA